MITTGASRFQSIRLFRFPRCYHQRGLSSSTSDDKVTFSKQDSLPILPVPSLKDTAARYFRAIQSLSDISPKDLEMEKFAVRNFPRQAAEFQRDLESITQTSYGKCYLFKTDSV